MRKYMSEVHLLLGSGGSTAVFAISTTTRLALAAYPDLTRRLQSHRCRLGRDRHRRGLAKHIKSPK